MFGPPDPPGEDADSPTALVDDLANITLEPSTAELAVTAAAEQLAGSQQRPSGIEAGTEPSPAVEPSAAELVTTTPAPTEPATANVAPATSEPTIDELATGELTIGEPNIGEPTVDEPTIAEPTTNELPAPTTEREYRDRKGLSTESILPVGTDPWSELLATGRYARYLPLLCEHYIQLCHAKADNEVLFECEYWPEAEGLDFDGFINWLWRCKEVDPLQGVGTGLTATLAKWQASAKARAVALARRLKEANPVSLPTFTDANYGFCSASEFYTDGARSLLEIDADEAGVEIS